MQNKKKKTDSIIRIMCYMIPFIYISGQGRALGQERKICQQMFLEALFIITKTWKQLKCPSVGEWRNKLWYLQTMGYYSELKINELSRHGWILNVHYKWKKATWKEIWKKQNYGDSKKISSARVLWRGMVSKQSTGDFENSEYTVMLDNSLHIWQNQ